MDGQHRKAASAVIAELTEFVKNYDSNDALKYVILHKLKAMSERKMKCKAK